MTGLSTANYGNYYAAAATPKGVTVRNSNGAIIPPTKTAIRDVYTSSTAVNTLTVKEITYTPNSLKAANMPKNVTILPKFDIKTDKFLSSTAESQAWAFGQSYNDRFNKGIEHSSQWLQHYKGPATGGAHDLRTDHMMIQARLEATERTLNEQIDNALKASGISLAEKDRLDFSIDQFSRITITGGFSDADGRKQILEDIMNGDDALRSNVFLYMAQKSAVTGKSSLYEGTEARIFDSDTVVEYAYNLAHGNGIAVHEGYEWALQFSYQDGKIFQGDDCPEDRVFSGRLDSLAGLGQIIGLEESAAEDIQSFVNALERNIAADTSKLTGLLNAALKKAKLGDVTKKITFSQDAEGKIVIEGNIRDNQKERLAQIINDDSELCELIKTQSAKKAVLAELKGSITDAPEGKTATAWHKHMDKAGYGFDLSKNSLAPAREQLMKNFLDRSGISMSELQANPDAVFANHEELGEIKGFRNEMTHLIAQKAKKAASPATESEPLLAMKRGELVEVTNAYKGLDVEDEISGLKGYLNEWIADANRWHEYQTGDTGLDIVGYSLTFDHTGRASLEVKTADGDPQSAATAKSYLTTYYLKSDTFQEVGLAILDAHDDEHGDVKEYAHSVIIESGTDDYRIESEEADQAALAEMETLSQDIGAALGEFFGKTMGMESPFNVLFGSDGLLSLGENSLSSVNLQAAKQVLEDINRYLVADEAGEDTEGMLSGALTGIGEKLIALKEVQDKIHDKSLLPKLSKEALRVAL